MQRFELKALLIPIAIVCAGLILAVAIYVFRLEHTLTDAHGNPDAVRPVTPADHIIGNPSAPVVVVEYGDIDDAYSKAFQLTMEQLMTDYAGGGKIAWVYRHFPLTAEHANAASEALAAECAASLSVPTTFFRFIDAMQTAAPGDTQFDISAYPALVAEFGIDQANFDKCMTDGIFVKHIRNDYDNALAAGATGSPFVVLLVHGQKPAVINGAIPYPSMKRIIDQAIKKAAS